jgi:hypothetical protein
MGTLETRAPHDRSCVAIRPGTALPSGPADRHAPTVSSVRAGWSG